MKVDITVDGYTLSTRKELLNIDLIHQYLSKKSYWSENIPMEVVKKSIEHSLCFGVYLGGEQIAFARLITDQATFAYLADVFVLESHRGKGVSKKLMQFIMDITAPMHLRRYLLGTLDAHTLYTQFGFTALAHPDRIMEISRPDIYKETSDNRH